MQIFQAQRAILGEPVQVRVQRTRMVSPKMSTVPFAASSNRQHRGIRNRDSPLKTRRKNTFRNRRTLPHGMPGRTQRIPSVTMPQDTEANHTPARLSPCLPCGSTLQRISNALFKSVGEYSVRKVVTDSDLAVSGLYPVVFHEGDDGRRSPTRPPRATTACALVIA